MGIYLPRNRADWTIALVSVLVVAVVALLLLVPRSPPPGPVAGSLLPGLTAGLNGAGGLLLLIGFRRIRRGDVGGHRLCMLTALGLSALFLIAYVAHHWINGAVGYAGPLWVRPFYLTILLSHTVLAALVPPLALMTVHRASLGQFAHHRRLARWTLPIWLYVSLSGVLVYLLLYQLRPL